MLKDNKHYLDKAKANPEPLLDENYIFIDKETEIDKYVEDTKVLKELLTTCKTMIKRGKNPAEYYEEIIEIARITPPDVVLRTAVLASFDLPLLFLFANASVLASHSL